MNLSYLSKYRSQLMGVAACFIILCHSTFVLPGSFGDIYKVYVSQFMQIGVDIFLLVSGLGCYFSIKKTPSVLRFYRKRMIRILVPYLVFVIAYGVFNICFFKQSITDYLFTYSLVSFFTHGVLAVWFIAAILVLYLVFPLLYKLINRKSASMLILSVVIIGIVLLPIWENCPHALAIVREIFLPRIPVFLIGMWIGNRIYGERDMRINVGLCLSVFLISLIAFSLNAFLNTMDTWVVARLLFLPLSCSLCCLLSSGFRKIQLQKKRVGKAALFMGSLSLELYLVHEAVLHFITDYIPRPRFLFSILSDTLVSVVVNLLSIALACLIAWLIHWLSQKIIALLGQQNKRKA